MHIAGCFLLAGLLILNAWSFAASLQPRPRRAAALRRARLAAHRARRLVHHAVGAPPRLSEPA